MKIHPFNAIYFKVPGCVFSTKCFEWTGFINKFEKKATINKPAIAYIVVLYKLGVGSTVPEGAISINLDMVTVFAFTSWSNWSTGAPNLSKW